MKFIWTATLAHHAPGIGAYVCRKDLCVLISTYSDEGRPTQSYIITGIRTGAYDADPTDIQYVTERVVLYDARDPNYQGLSSDNMVQLIGQIKIADEELKLAKKRDFISDLQKSK
jgi:hypothetical protein